MTRACNNAHSDNVVQLDNVSITYGRKTAVRNLSLAVSKGEILGLIGESGSGKSSVLRAIGGLLPRGGKVSEGRILFNGSDTAALTNRAWAGIRGKDISYVFQDPILSLDPLFTLRSQFDESLMACGEHNRADFDRIEVEFLKKVGLEDTERVLASLPSQLSGGMAQRAVIAMCLACNPSLLLADEPTSALDVLVQTQILDLLAKVRDDFSTSILLVSHNVAAVAAVADRVGVMHNGTIVEIGKTDEVMKHPSHPYTKSLISAVPHISVRQ